MTDERRFPIQGGLTVSWASAEAAYATYARLFGRGQSLERLAERGGFGMAEFAMLRAGRCPGRDRRLDENLVAEELAKADVRRA